MDRQTDKQMDGQTDEQIDKQIIFDKQKEGQKYKLMK